MASIRSGVDSLLTRATSGRSFLLIVRLWRSRSPPPSIGPRPMEALTSRRSQSTRVGHTNSFRHRITRLERSRSSGSTSGSSDQRDGARESVHQTRDRPQGSRGGRRRPAQTGTPNDSGTTRGFLLRRARPPCRGRMARRGYHLAPRPALGCATGAATNRAGDH
jgi:hypothetical protein